jgi:cell wall-associated NlpC family hydrolase
MSREDLLKALFKYANHLYIWGESGPLYYDCSGLIFRILTDDLKIGPIQRLNAQGYYDYFKDKGTTALIPDLGCLAFYGKLDAIHHIALCLDRENIFESARGDRNCTSAWIAQNKNAKVEVNPISRLPDLFAVLKPNNLIFT